MNSVEQLGNPELVECMKQFHKKIKEINDNLDVVFDSDTCDNLSVKKKVQIELYLSYALNSFFWMHLRTTGKDPTKHSVVTEMMKVREYMSKYKEIIDRDKKPTVDAQAAKRFIKGALWEPKAKITRLDLPDKD
ncbi:nuclear nucleic acid-binding protein C1D-like [Ctenocephalides felis]|uniref:nuclear nucleic acid-binding protein C1D-like n=1 Tax=Ctenocephalides felis TaxID=7515 RepID=UPI000E6E1D16|nr:nuclear nucleic acid-binding protein C1D-like [Ctenocephalides felis]